MSLVISSWQINQRAELYSQLSQLTSAGIGLPQAIEMQRRNASPPAFRQALTRLGNHLEAGLTFGQALSRLASWIPAFDQALLAAGETSGRLPESFTLLANYYRQKAHLIRSLLAYVAYPAFVFHVALLIFPIKPLQRLVLEGEWLGYVLQKLLFFLPLYALVFLGISVLQGTHGEQWRTWMEKALSQIPGLGPARRYLALARLSASLEALISAGINLIEAWELASAASGSPVLCQIVRKNKTRLYEGLTPAEMVRQSSAFPDHFSAQYHTGEVSGQLETSLAHLSGYYQQEGFRKLKTFIIVMAGGLIGFVMLFAAWQIISFWMNYYEQIQQAIPE